MRPLTLDRSVASIAGLAVIVPLIVLALEPAPRPPGFQPTQEPAISHHHRVHHQGKVPRVRLLKPHGHASPRGNITAPAPRARPHQKPKLRQPAPSDDRQRAHRRDEDQYLEEGEEEQRHWQEELLNREQPLGGAVMADDNAAAPTPAPTAKPIGTSALPAGTNNTVLLATNADGDRELLCLFRVYMDSFVSIGKVDMNDRLVFLVPLIIIYWHHRHPHHGLPYREIDGLLRDIGPEGQVHRLVLQEVSRRVGGECARENAGPLASTLSRQHNKQAKAVEAMRILREWLDEEERLEEQTARQSGAREIRHWFRDLVGTNKRRGSGASSSANTAPASSTIAQPTRAAPATTTALTADETTTDFYGLPNYENRTRETRDQASVTTQKPAGVNMTLLTELNQLEPANSSSSSTSGGAVSRSSGGSSGSVPQPPSHYGEFFDLVTSIIDEINVLHNSTAAIMTAPTTSPTLV